MSHRASCRWFALTVVDVCGCAKALSHAARVCVLCAPAWMPSQAKKLCDGEERLQSITKVLSASRRLWGNKTLNAFLPPGSPWHQSHISLARLFSLGRFTIFSFFISSSQSFSAAERLRYSFALIVLPCFHTKFVGFILSLSRLAWLILPKQAILKCLIKNQR